MYMRFHASLFPRRYFPVLLVAMIAVSCFMSMSWAQTEGESQVASLSGVVRYNLTLISGAQVSLSPGGYETVSIVGGAFSFTDIPVGQYMLSVTAAGYEPWSITRNLNSGVNLQFVELTPLVETGSLSGVVRESGTLALVSGAVVSLSPGGFTDTTSIAGTFSIADIPAGEYEMTVTAARYEPWNLERTISNGVNLQDVTLTPVSSSGSLSGVVRESGTLALVSGAVVILSPGGFTDTTSIAGTFSIADIPAGDYEMTVTAAGYEPWNLEVTVSNGINLQDVELILSLAEGEGEPEGEIEGETGLFHPADLNGDWRMVMSEAISYLSGWQRGGNPMAYAIRAAYLWQNGEYYDYDDGFVPPLCWVLAPAP